MTSFMDNEIPSSGAARLYTIPNLRYYSMYQFDLTAIYGSDSSTAESTVTNITAEVSKFVLCVILTCFQVR